MSRPTFSMIVPTLNEQLHVVDHLRYHRKHFEFDEVVVVDGGSRDRTVQKIRSMDETIRLIQCSPAGRGRQLREGVRVSRGEWLVLVHADTRLPASFSLDRLSEGSGRWGWFDCRLDEPGWKYAVISRAVSWRSALFSSPTGDQALWMNRALLERVGGVPDQPLMEDVELVRRLRSREPGRRIKTPVTTSARKWQNEGVLKTILQMWFMKLSYFIGVPPRRLERWYYGNGSPGTPPPRP